MALASWISASSSPVSELASPSSAILMFSSSCPGSLMPLSTTLTSGRFQTNRSAHSAGRPLDLGLVPDRLHVARDSRRQPAAAQRLHDDHPQPLAGGIFQPCPARPGSLRP